MTAKQAQKPIATRQWQLNDCRWYTCRSALLLIERRRQTLPRENGRLDFNANTC